MTDTGIELQDNDEINVEEIMEKIREKIRKSRQEIKGEVNSHPLETLQTPASPQGASDTELYFINANWDIHNNSYFISSHRPFIGKVLVKSRQLVHSEVRRYIDPVISRQTDFNHNITGILENLINANESLEKKIERNELRLRDEFTEKIAESRNEMNEIQEGKLESVKKELVQEIGQGIVRQASIQEGKLESVKKELIKEISGGIVRQASIQEEKLESVKKELIQEIGEGIARHASIQEEKLGKVSESVDKKISMSVNTQIINVLDEMDLDIKNRVWLAEILEKRIIRDRSSIPNESIQAETEKNTKNFDYFSFEECFRGPSWDIKNKQSQFLPYFRECSLVLDIGCGRGEFLELLVEHEIGCKGIDNDSDMIRHCCSRKLNVEHAEALSYLEKLETGSVDGIFIGQMVEHLEPATLVKLLDLCYKKLKSGSYIVIETVNPLSFLSFANFYLDMSHTKPVHPETLKFLLKSANFSEITIKFFSTIPDDAKLKKIFVPGEIENHMKEWMDSYNYNVELLNQVLWGPMDYAVVGRKYYP